ncbi:wd-40 repeat protein [Anaeramoeba ignava]|uniref:Wd-40 repeat protein n=1 Tax=Anaeramoeba ignava TaxID=1746090 RepID=A0A9Q0RA54_ANAIG|nr:wd-40 repeat protein [Anaeramoeba ignava]
MDWLYTPLKQYQYSKWIFVKLLSVKDLNLENPEVNNDFYCKLYVEHQLYQTRAIFGTQSPEFNQTFRFGLMNKKKKLTIEIYQFKSFINDIKYGSVFVTLQGLKHEQSNKFAFDIPNASSGKVFIELTYISFAKINLSDFHLFQYSSTSHDKSSILSRRKSITGISDTETEYEENENQNISDQMENQDKISEKEITNKDQENKNKKSDFSDDQFEDFDFINGENQNENENENENENQNQNQNQFENEKDDQPLTLDFIYGYHGWEGRNNLHFISEKEIIYTASTRGIIYNMKTHKQEFLQYHESDIYCDAINYDKTLFCTAEMKDNPLICVWDIKERKLLSSFFTQNENGIEYITFSEEGTRLVTVGSDSKHTISLYDWKKRQLICSHIGDENNKIFYAQFNSFSQTEFITCGFMHLTFWSYDANSNSLIFKKPEMGKKETKYMFLSLLLMNNHIFCGNKKGDILIFNYQTHQLINTLRAHNGPCFLLKRMNDEIFFTCGKDGKMLIFSSLNFQKNSQIQLGIGSIRSADCFNNQMIFGNLKNQIWEMDLETKKPNLVLFGNIEPVYGLAVHPKKKEFLTACDDRTLRLWDSTTHSEISKKSINGQPRLVIFSDDGEYIALVLRDGEFYILRSDNYKHISNRKDTTSFASTMSFSPDSRYFAMAYFDGKIDIYDSNTGFRKNQSIKIDLKKIDIEERDIKALNWSSDSKYLQILQIPIKISTFSFETNKLLSKEEEEELKTQNIQWKGNRFQNIQQFQDYSESFSQVQYPEHKNLFVALDRSNKMKLFSLPLDPNKIKTYNAHDTPIAQVDFIQDSHVLSVGGEDRCIFQWKLNTKI